MSDQRRPPLTGLLQGIDQKLTPHGFKKIDSPKAWADLQQYLQITDLTGAGEVPLRANDHIWVRVERDAEGTLHHEMVVVPFDPSVTIETPALHLYGTITPEDGSLEDAAITAGSRVMNIYTLLHLPDAQFASKLEPREAAQRQQGETVPVRPGLQPEPEGLKAIALKGLRTALRYLTRKP